MDDSSNKPTTTKTPTEAAPNFTTINSMPQSAAAHPPNIDLSTRPSTLSSSSARMEQHHNDCAICLHPLDPSVVVGDELQLLYALQCRHTFHRACIAPWLTRSTECPICRAFAGTTAMHGLRNVQQQPQSESTALLEGEGPPGHVTPMLIGIELPTAAPIQNLYIPQQFSSFYHLSPTYHHNSPYHHHHWFMMTNPNHLLQAALQQAPAHFYVFHYRYSYML